MQLSNNNELVYYTIFFLFVFCSGSLSMKLTDSLLGMSED